MVHTLPGRINNEFRVAASPKVIELLKNHTMRLSTKELQALRAIMGELDPAGRIYLYGSRADDTRRGGDIDLYLQASRPIDLKARLRAQYRLQQACDIRVDLLVKNPAQPELPLHQIAVERGVLL